MSAEPSEKMGELLVSAVTHEPKRGRSGFTAEPLHKSQAFGERYRARTKSEGASGFTAEPLDKSRKPSGWKRAALGVRLRAARVPCSSNP